MSSQRPHPKEPEMTFTTRTSARPALRRASPLRFVLTLAAAVLSSTLTLAGVLALFELDARAATLARSAPALTGTASASAQAPAGALPAAASGV
jgi:hypothetical protein